MQAVEKVKGEFTLADVHPASLECSSQDNYSFQSKSLHMSQSEHSMPAMKSDRVFGESKQGGDELKSKRVLTEQLDSSQRALNSKNEVQNGVLTRNDKILLGKAGVANDNKPVHSLPSAVIRAKSRESESASQFDNVSLSED